MSLRDSPARVVLCSLEPIVVGGIQALLSNCADLEFEQATDSLAEAAEILSRSRPAVLMVDRSFGPRVILDWLETTKADRLADGRNLTGIILWGASGNESEAVRYLKAGARGFLRKTADMPTVLACLRGIAAGRTWMEESDSNKHQELTSREQQVLSLIERGFRNKEIGQELGISEGTVKIHVMHVFRKTGLSRHALALKALSNNVELSENDHRSVQSRSLAG